MSSTTRTAPAPAGPSRGRTVGPRVPAPPARRPRPLTPSRPLLLLAALLGLGSAALGAWLLRHPGSVLATDPEVFLVRAVLGASVTAVLLVVLGLLGTVAALLALRDRPAGHALLAVALVQLVAFGTALQSVTTISLAGYLAAAALLPAVVVLAGLVVRRYRRLRWLVLAAALGVVVAVAAAWAEVSASLVRLGRALAGGFATAAPRLGVTVLTAAVLAVWLLVAVRLGRDSGAARTAGGWVQRHRVALTLVAAAGPLPYGLVRLTWLTPWPLLSPTTALPGELRLWGLLLGGAALVGTVLTLGLVLPWGETFPRWFPRLAGRRVPVAAAVVPGGLVAGLVCAAALPMLRMALLPAPDEVSGGLSLVERLELAVLMPFWLWGPALALAVWGYARHRTSAAAASAPGTGAGG